MLSHQGGEAVDEGGVCANGLRAVVAVLAFFLGVFFVFNIEFDQGFDVFLCEGVGVDDDRFFVVCGFLNRLLG